MESKEISGVLDIQKFLTFSISSIYGSYINLCFTVRPNYSDSDYLLYRKWNIADQTIIQKSVKFVPGKTIKSHSFSPDGNWQAVLTGQGGIYIFPVQTVLGEIQSTRNSWNTDDSTNLNTRLGGQPECILWWNSFRNDDIGVIGCKTGQLVLIDLSTGSYLTQVDVQGHINSCELVRTNDNATVYCLIKSRAGNQWKLTLEEQTSSLPASSAENGRGSEPSCIYLQDSTYLGNGGKFEPRKMYQFPQSVQLQYQCYDDKHFVSGFNSNKNRLHIYDAGALESSALFIFRICETAVYVLIHETLIYAVYRNDQGQLRLGIYCRQHAHCPDGEDVSMTFSLDDARRAKLGDFSLSGGNLVGLYLLPNCLKPEFRGCYSLAQWTDIPPVLAVTKKGIHLIFQKHSFDEKFLDLLLHEKRQREAEWLGVGLKLDLNWLYEMAAEKVGSQVSELGCSASKNALKVAGEYFELARTPVHRRIQCLSKYFSVKDLLRYLSALLRNPDQLTSIEKSCVSNAMMICFARILAEDPNDQSTADKYKVFVLNNFHFNQMKAIYSLLDYGLVSEALFLCRERGFVVEAIQHLRDHEWACHTAQCRIPIASSLRRALVVKERNNVLRAIGPADMEVLALSNPQLLSALAEECIRWCEADLEDDVLSNLSECFSPHGVTLQRLISFIEEPDGRDRSQTNFTVSMYNSLDSMVGNEQNLKPVISVLLRAYVAVVLRQQQSKVHPLEFMNWWQKLKTPKTKRTESVSTPLMSLGINPVAAVVCYAGALHVFGGPELPIRTFKRRVREVACGLRHALVVDWNGVLFSCGNNFYGQLGVDPTCTTFPGNSAWRPSLCPLIDMPAIRLVCAGHYHSLALTADDSSVLAWGWNLHGQLGINSVEDSWRYKKVQLIGGRCTAISAGAHHSMLLRDDGRVYLFGGNQFGQLAREDILKSSAPIPLKGINTPVKLIATKYFHSLCVTTDNKVYQWGLHPNVWSCIGERGPFDTICQPHRLKLRKAAPVTQIACGANHSVILCSDGSVHTVGRNQFGQLGTGNKVNLTTDMAMIDELIDISQIAADENVTMAITRQGHLYMWGCASHPAAEFFSRPGHPDLCHPVCVSEFDRMQRPSSTDATVVKDINKEELIIFLQPWLDYTDEQLMDYLISRNELNIIADLLLVKRKYLQSLVWRLKSLDQSNEDLSDSVIQIAEFYLSEIHDADSSDFTPTLIIILQWFKKNDYPFQLLEAVLLPKLSKVSWEVIKILQKLKLYSSFSPNFIIQVFSTWYKNINRQNNRNAQQYNGQMPPIAISSDELIAEIENTVLSTIYKISYSKEKKVTVFACGHKFGYSIYKNDLVPELIHSFQQHKKIDIDAIKSAYSDDKDCLLCPVCVRAIYFTDQRLA